MINITGFQ